MYERKLPVELHIKDPELLSKLKKDISNNEIMNIKILVRGDEDDPDAIRVEMFSQSDYFFLYEHTCDFDNFMELKREQGLKPEFSEYLTMLIKLFNATLPVQKKPDPALSNSSTSGNGLPALQL